MYSNKSEFDKVVIDRWMWAGSHSEAGAVSVRSDHREAVSGQEVSAYSEGDEARVVPGHKVLKTAEEQIIQYPTCRNRICTHNTCYLLTKYVDIDEILKAIGAFTTYLHNDA